MIYLTSQLVRSSRFKQSGVNAFRHHKPGPIPAGEPRDVLGTVAEDPGEVAAVSVTIPPGGNSVEAFLDIVADDGLKDLDAALADFRASVLGARTNDQTDRVRNAVIRFYAIGDRTAKYDQLGGAVLALHAGRETGPLVVIVGRHEEATILSLDQGSVDRLRRFHGTAWNAPRLRIADDVAAAFEQYVGDIKEHLVAVLTGLDLHYVRGLGGVQFRSAEGRVLGQWP